MPSLQAFWKTYTVGPVFGNVSGGIHRIWNLAIFRENLVLWPLVGTGPEDIYQSFQ